VFPSYLARDRRTVEPFLRALAAAGFSVFDAVTDLGPGVNWAQTIHIALHEAAARGWVVAFLSANSMRSLEVQKEIQLGLHLGAKFVPVFLERVSIPAHLSSIQAFDAFTDLATAPARLAELLLLRS
jgi:hypothetical protein